MKLLSLSFLLSALILAAPLVSTAASRLAVTGPVDITADTLEYDRANNLYTARGDVELREGVRYLKADFVTYNEVTDDVFAEGNVLFREEQDQVEAERLTINLATKLGTIEKGKIFLKAGNFYIDGQEITKTGETTYVIQRGEFTTCGWDRPAWKFTARDVNITVHGYATAKSATFRILGQPVLYLPWSVFPVLSERQSGFLLPQILLSSRLGPVFSDSYFWAIDKDKDATFYLDLLQQRGVKPGVEYRYALSDTLKGHWYGSIIDDKDYGHTRYEIMGEHQQQIKDMSFKSRIEYVSDMDYLKDYGLTPLERAENMVRSTAFAEKPFGESLLTVETSYFRTLLAKDNDTTFKYLPFVSYFTQYEPIIKNMAYFSLSSDMLNSYREQGDKFTRFTLAPAVHVPYRWNGLNFLFGATGYENIYAFNRDQPDNGRDTQRLESMKLEADMNAQFIKNSSTDLFKIGEFQSLIKPRISYTYVPHTALGDIPTIDPSNQLSQLNAVTYSFNHYLTGLSKEGARELSLLEVTQTYGLSGNLTPSDLYDGSGKRLSDIRAKLTLYPRPGLSTVHETVYNPYGDGFRILRNSFVYTNLPRFKFDITQSYTKDLVNEVNTGFVGTYRSFDGMFRIRYSLQDSTWIDQSYSVTYRPKCWSVSLSVIRTRLSNDTSIRLSFNLAGITQTTRDATRIGSYR